MSEPPPAPVKPKGHALVRAVVDYGGLVAFMAAYFLRLRFVPAANTLHFAVAIGGHGPRDLTAATWWLVIGSVIALAVGIIAERRLAPMPLITGAFALVFGALTLALHDPRFIKIKPTATNFVFGAALMIGLMLKRNPLKWLLGEALVLPDEAWKTLTVRYALYFFAMAALNEIIWRTQSDTVWVLFRMPGLWICVLIFSFSQVPFMMKYMKTSEAVPPPAD